MLGGHLQQLSFTMFPKTKQIATFVKTKASPITTEALVNANALQSPVNATQTKSGLTILDVGACATSFWNVFLIDIWTGKVVLAIVFQNAVQKGSLWTAIPVFVKNYPSVFPSLSNQKLTVQELLI